MGMIRNAEEIEARRAKLFFTGLDQKFITSLRTVAGLATLQP